MGYCSTTIFWWIFQVTPFFRTLVAGVPTKKKISIVPNFKLDHLSWLYYLLFPISKIHNKQNFHQRPDNCDRTPFKAIQETVYLSVRHIKIWFEINSSNLDFALPSGNGRCEKKISNRALLAEILSKLNFLTKLRKAAHHLTDISKTDINPKALVDLWTSRASGRNTMQARFRTEAFG